MAVANIECRLAQAQMSLFLSGDPLGDDVLGDLEDHIAGCTDCRRLLATKRAEILARQTPLPTAEPVPKAPSRWRLGKSERAAHDMESAVVEARPRGAMGKPLLYSVALAGVLVAMSFFSNPTRLFGDRIAPPTPVAPAKKDVERPPTAEPNPLSAAADEAASSPEVTPKIVASDLAIESATAEGAYPLDEIDQPPATPNEERAAAAFMIQAMRDGVEEAPATPIVKPAEAPPVTEKATVKPAARRVRRVRSQTPRRPSVRRPVVRKQASKGGGIRVYDSQGNLIRP